MSLRRTADRFIWTLSFSIALAAFLGTIILLFFKGGMLGAILATIILLKIWEV